ncbi:MAG: hypothetical protein GTO41_13240, partial [Burkholderiales bacterium]|nr:hypothetical protein [Burkholderiales bacterium]
MPDTYYLAGSGFNLIDGSTVAVTSENSLFPKANLYDNRPSRPFKFNAAAADDYITFDLGAAKNVDFCSIHYHNIDTGVTAIRLYSKTSAFASATDGTLEATFTKATPTFYTHLTSPVNRRYWKVSFIGTNGSPIELGEIVLGEASVFTNNQRPQWETQYRRRQIRNTTRAGEVHVYNITDQEERIVQLTYRPDSSAAFEEVRDDIYQGTNGGATPFVIVPDGDREEVIHGRI